MNYNYDILNIFFYQNIFPEEYLFYNSQDCIQFEHLFKRLESYYGADLEPIQKAKLSLWFSSLLKNRQKKIVRLGNSVHVYCIT